MCIIDSFGFSKSGTLSVYTRHNKSMIFLSWTIMPSDMSFWGEGERKAIFHLPWRLTLCLDMRIWAIYATNYLVMVETCVKDRISGPLPVNK